MTDQSFVKSFRKSTTTTLSQRQRREERIKVLGQARRTGGCEPVATYWAYGPGIVWRTQGTR